jgi:hypothetical protein
MCEQLGTEPIPEEIPAEFEDFAYEVQRAINIFYILPDVFEGMSGTYMGKNYSILPYLFEEIYKVENKQQTMQFILLINSIVTKQYRNQQEARDRKAKTKKGGINVNG